MASERKAQKAYRRGRNASGNNTDANEVKEREPENIMAVRRRAAQVGERREEWKVNSVPNAKTNASKLAKNIMVVMGWASNTESASF